MSDSARAVKIHGAETKVSALFVFASGGIRPVRKGHFGLITVLREGIKSLRESVVEPRQNCNLGGNDV